MHIPLQAGSLVFFVMDRFYSQFYSGTHSGHKIESNLMVFTFILKNSSQVFKLSSTIASFAFSVECYVVNVHCFSLQSYCISVFQTDPAPLLFLDGFIFYSGPCKDSSVFSSHSLLKFSPLRIVNSFHSVKISLTELFSYKDSDELY